MTLVAWFVALTLLHRPRFWGRLFGPRPSSVGPLRVRARASHHVWAEARADGDVRYSAWLERGQVLTLEAQQEVYIWCGQADKLSLTVNGKPVGTLASVTDSQSRSPAWYTFRNNLP